MKYLLITAILFATTAKSQETILITDSCKLSKDCLKWIFTDSTVTILSMKNDTIKHVTGVEKVELRNDDEILMISYLRGDAKYAVSYSKKYNFYLVITDMILWKEGDMTDERCAYPIKL